MKKNLLTIAVFFLVSTVTINCSKEKEEAKNCTELLSRANAAEIALTTNPSPANCQAAKTALNNLLGCSYLSAAERASYQAVLNSLPPC